MRYRHRSDASLCVYFLLVGDTVKIGLSNNVKLRAETLTRGTGCASTILGVIAASTRLEASHLERTLHHRFAHLRVCQEYFAATGPLLTWIAQHARPAETLPTPDPLH